MILKEFHGSTDSNIHIGGNFDAKAIAHKILRTGYYWPSFSKYSYKYVQSCDECQRETSRESREIFPHAFATSNTRLSFCKEGIRFHHIY
jgi:hypothetical protein